MEIGGGNALEPTYTKYYAMLNGAGWSECEWKPLSEVVGDCVQRWFQDAYKEARKGDIANQVLVAQMFFSGYGTPKNEYKI
ncbi:unnamed protein product [Miscanthus lutarioriparius]|uniref:Uncharacterized protein n=1 Tax=Miscanthus lutarioriparius TaxID=422564 RepID=A0A811Q1I4_9POAL|nr:unnamed protein product [Miscanthus lutarioriparius]